MEVLCSFQDIVILTQSVSGNTWSALEGSHNEQRQRSRQHYSGAGRLSIPNNKAREDKEEESEEI